MTKPISKSKRQLAQLLIEAGVTQFPEGANWAAQDKSCDTAFFIGKPRRSSDGQSWLENLDTKCGQRTFDINNAEVYLPTLIPNWHQTVLSRDEFDQIVAETVVQDEPQYCESVMRSIPEPTAAPTLDQLLQDWRNADDYAQRKQTEADEAAAMRDERWQAVQARTGEMGVTVWRCESEPVKPVTTGKFRNAKLGSPESYHRELKDEICDECGLRFGLHYNLRCKP